MDIERDKPRDKRKYFIAGGVSVLLLLGLYGISRLRPAETVMDRTVMTFDTVTVGDMVRDVRGPGTLVAEHTRIIVATTGGRVETLPVRPGAQVEAGTTIVQLSNSDVALSALQVQQQLTQAYANLAQLKSVQQQQSLSQQSTVAQLRTQKLEAERVARVVDTLANRKLTSRNEIDAAHERAQELATRYTIEEQRAAAMTRSDAEQIKLAEQQIDGLKRIVQEQQNRSTSMRVTAGEAGELQSLGNPRLELGQWVNSGIELARVSQPGRLKAVLRIPENLAKDVAIGQKGTIDTRDGFVTGSVTSVDPISREGSVTVEVSLDGELPKGARADLTIDGAIEIERLRNVVHVGRPAYGSAQSQVKIFKVIPNTGEAVRVDVMLGKASVNNVEVRNGLVRGDSIIISDMSLILGDERIKLRGKS